VQFADTSPKALTLNSKISWDFGDGQTSEQANPTHVYLRPGLFTVKLTATRANKPFSLANRVYIDQPKVTGRDKLHQLDDYLPILRAYNPKTLDARSLRQLLAAHQAKADALLAPPEESKPGEPPSAAELERQAQQAAVRKAEAMKEIAAAVAAGRAGLVEESAAQGGQDVLEAARLAGPMARDQLGDSRQAGSIWSGAAKRIEAGEAKAECLVEAADIAVNDLVNVQAARSFLDAASAILKDAKSGAVAARLQRIWGDYYALSGDGKAARKAYFAAEAMSSSRRNNVERAAWQGAHGRSTEQFIKTGEFDRAASQIRQWQEEFPADKVNGYVTLMVARYWQGRQKYPQAVALAGQLSAVNADSPYIDQLLLLAAECELAAGDAEKAVHRLEALVKSYPGSPLLPDVKEKITQWKAGGEKPPAKPSRSGKP
jgi:PKD repeat protein